jgi:formylglycine-generating enzyme required for sulfatase activity/energy-coupling factor transporter ATP-binding protein EcfA2
MVFLIFRRIVRIALPLVLMLMMSCTMAAAVNAAESAAQAEQAKSVQTNAGAWDWKLVLTAVGVLLTGAAGINAYKKLFDKGKPEETAKLEAQQEFKENAEDEESARQYEEYKQCLIAEHDQSALPSTTVIESFTVSLSGTYVSLWLSDTLRTEEIIGHFGKLLEDDGQRYRTPQEVLCRAFEDERRMLLVIGAPGSGKTTLLRHYLLSMLKDGKYDDFGFQPATKLAFLALRELKKIEGATIESDAFFKTLPQQLLAKEDGRRNEETVARWLQTGRTLVLFDGLDEIGNEQERITACKWIDRQASLWPKACIVVTSRPTGYRKGDGIELRTPLVRADIMGFSPEQQDDYLDKWFREFYHKRELRPEGKDEGDWQREQHEKAAEKTQAIIAFLNDPKNATLRRLAATPLLLQIMALLWKERDRLPDSRVELYDGALHYLLGYRDEKNGIKPLMPPPDARQVLAPLALWMQEEVREDEAEKEPMVEKLQEELRVLTSPPPAATFFDYLVNRAGLLVRDGQTSRYRFSHKTFREYLAGFQMKEDRPYNHIASLLNHFGEDWWNEPLRFFMWQVDAKVFDSFMKALFESPKSAELTQKEQDLLALLVAEAPRRKIDALKAKLLDRGTTARRQRYLLDCLAVIASDEAVGAVQECIGSTLMKDRDVMLRACEIVGVTPAEITIDVYPNPHEEGAQYLLIKGGVFRYSVTDSSETVPDLYVARYPVTNRLYRRFIEWLAAGGDAQSPLSPDGYRNALLDLAKRSDDKRFSEYLQQGKDLANRLRSRCDDDVRFNGGKQPVVGVSWYGAKAYCIWLSMLESGGKNTTLYRLPTEQEWEYAAAGIEGRKYPWGSTPEPTPKHANYGENEGATTPVGRYPDGATSEGLYDMAGNAWEWCHDWSDSNKECKALRGGSWNFGADNLRCQTRYIDYAIIWYDFFGFRVVRPSLTVEP